MLRYKMWCHDIITLSPDIIRGENMMSWYNHPLANHYLEWNYNVTIWLPPHQILLGVKIWCHDIITPSPNTIGSENMMPRYNPLSPNTIGSENVAWRYNHSGWKNRYDTFTPTNFAICTCTYQSRLYMTDMSVMIPGVLLHHMSSSMEINV